MRFIKLFEKITEWEWYDDVATCRVFIHLLLTANWKDTSWHGIKIKRGQRIISFRGLAEETNLSEQQIRTAISHLKATHELTQYSTHHYTIVTVENYESYQGCDKTTNTPSNAQPNTASTSDIEEYRTIEENNNTSYSTNTQYYSKRKNQEPKPIPLRKQIPPTVEMVKAYCEERHNGLDAEYFCDFYTSKNWMVGKDKMKDWQASVRTWEKNHGTNRNNQTAGESASRITDAKRRAVEEWEARHK